MWAAKRRSSEKRDRAGLPRRNTILAVALLVVAALVLAACERRVTHETGNVQNTGYDPDQIVELGNGTYRASTDHGYNGSTYSAKAHYEGYTGTGAPPTSRAYGGFDVNVPEGGVGTAAAAFYFPVGTFTGSTPGQEGRVDIMRWDGPENTAGMIRLAAGNHKARLMRSQGGNLEVIGDPFTFKEGCWNWLAVNQKISSEPWDGSGHATNRVYLNGRKIIDSDAPNKYDTTSTGGATTVRFGMPWLETGTANSHQNDRSLDIYVDDAYVSDTNIPAPAPNNTCEPPKPNILFIVTDDQRAIDTMHSMPNTLKWFRDGGVMNGGSVIDPGIEFGEGYATTPLCCPARSSILTGKYAHNHGVRNNDESAAIGGSKTETQVQSMLKAEGYRTGIAGKYLNDWNPYLAPPNFDRYWIGAGYYSYFNNNGTIECKLPSDTSCTYNTTYLENKALEFINDGEANGTADSQPWFLYLAPWAPHQEGGYPFSAMPGPATSYNPPAPPSVPSRSEGPQSDPRSTNPIEDKPTNVQNYKQSATILAGTEPNNGGLRDQSLRSLKALDDSIDRLFQRLKETGEERDTLAVFISDNGLQWREHGIAANEISTSPDNPTAACPTAPCGLSAKAHPYTESIKVPMLLRWPANTSVVQSWTDSSRYVANIDLAPTALAAAGHSIPSDVDGRSLLDHSQERNEILTENWVGGSGMWASLRGRTTSPNRYYHYIEHYAVEGRTVTFREYYDLASDPWELNNLLSTVPAPPPAPGYPDPIPPDQTFQNYLFQRLAAARVCTGATCPPGASSSTLDEQPPRLWTRGLRDGDTIGDVASTKRNSFNLRASDNIGIDHVDFYVDGTLTGTRSTPPYNFYVEPLSVGTHQLKGIAKDYANNASAPAQTTVKVAAYDVQADNVSGWPTGVLWENAPGTGVMEQGDSLTFSLDHAITRADVLSAWTGDPYSVTLRVNPDVDIDPADPTTGYEDAITIPEVPKLGTIYLGSTDPIMGWRLPGSHADIPATMTMPDSQTVRITLGQVPAGLGLGRSPNFTMLAWRPASSAICPSPCTVRESLNNRNTQDGEF
jgi:arylsulfatase A-like enzyme